MKISKIIEGIGFTMLTVAFILYFLNRMGYFSSLEDLRKYMGLAGMAIWAFAYGYNAKEKTED